MTTKTLTGYYVNAYKLTSPITTLSIAATAYLGGGIAAVGTSTYTIVNQGIVRGANGAVVLAGRGVITNNGTLDCTDSTANAGVVLAQGGVVTNNSGALISGYYGVGITGQTGTVNNQGLIVGAGKYGVELAVGGVVTNGSATNTTATIRGGKAIVSGAGATVTNFGSILGTGTAGVGGYLKLGGVMTNGSATDKTALIEATGIGFAIEGASGTLTNFGTVVVTLPDSAGLALTGGGVMTNGSASDTTALIRSGAAGCLAEGVAATVNNYGTIEGGYGTLSFTGSAVYLENGGTITNGASKDTSARITGVVATAIGTVTGTIINFGTLGGLGTEVGAALLGGGVIVNGSAVDTKALIQAYIGAAGGGPTTIENFGTIIGSLSGGTLASLVGAIYLSGGGSVINGSSVDTKATLLGGEVGIHTETIVATVTNFGRIDGDFVGLLMDEGGRVTNGSTADTGATIAGTAAGVGIGGANGTVTNFGVILGGALSRYGVQIESGGAVTNGSSTDHGALIKGFIGVDAQGATSVTNNATISGDRAEDSYGVLLGGTSKLTNNAGALISGYTGVSIGAECTATNFGTIQALGYDATAMNRSTARLNAEAGSVFKGTIYANGGSVVDVVSGLATATGIDSAGKIEGAGTLSLAGAGSLLQAGVSLLVSKIMIGAGETVEIATKLVDSRVWDQTAGTLTVDTGDQMAFTGAGDSFSGTVTGSGAVLLSGGSDTLSNVTLSAGKMTINKAAVTFGGAVAITGTVSATSTSMVVAVGGATFSGGGELSLSNNATNSLKGANSGVTLTNGDIIRGAGKLGAGTMKLVNSSTGVIEGVGSAGLTIDTGANTIANAGTIEALGDVTTITSAVANTGLLASSNGTLAVTGAVTGAGLVHVFGGVVSFAAAFNEHVTFGSTGRLVLAQSTTFTNTVSGFSHAGTTSFDLRDINFASATTSFSGTTASGVLTVSDGTHTAHLHFIGDYTAASWTLSNDGGGGTVVIDPTAAKAHAIVAAAAGMGAGSAASAAPGVRPPILATILAHGQG